MSTAHVPLPDGPFRVAEGLAAGYTIANLRARRLHRPVWGIRSRHHVDTEFAHWRALLHRLGDGVFVCGISAAHFYEVPTPARLADRLPVHIGVAPPARAPHANGVRGPPVRP